MACLTVKTRWFNACFAVGLIGVIRSENDQLKKRQCFLFYPLCSTKCLALISTWWPTFCVSLWAKTGSLTLMFNSAIVFDERFCLDWDPQGGTSVANLAYMLYLWKKVGWNNKCQVWVRAHSHKKIFSLPQEVRKSRPNKRGLSPSWHILLNERSVWMAALWDHRAVRMMRVWW